MTSKARRPIELIALGCHADLTADRVKSLLHTDGIHVPHGAAWDGLRPLIEQTAALLMRLPREAPFGSYLVADKETREIVGICGFKDGPRCGVVEIAYHTFPAYEGLGYATAAAAALRDLALSSRLVHTVTARTLREVNASTRVLTRCGFAWSGEVNDPEDGLVWQWEQRRTAADGPDV